MTPIKYPLSCKKGTTFRKKWYLFDKDKKPLDLSSYTGRMQIKVDFDSEALIELTTENSGIVIAENYIELFIDDSDTSSLFDPGSYKYDIEIVSGSNGDVSCPFFGSFKVTDEVTR
jgi:hypothetical protein